jgi:hypothetical protein
VISVSPNRAASVMSMVLAVLVPALVGVVVFLVIQNHDQDQELLRQGRSAIQQNVTARYDDCRAGDEVRRALYHQARSSARSTRLLLRLVPSLDTRQVRRLAAKRRARQLRTFQPRGIGGCARYALRVVLPRDRDTYRVLP